jgi:hypothetical protein
MRYPAANHAAEAVVIYDLNRAEAYRGPVDNQAWSGVDLDACPAPVDPAQGPQ